VKLAKFEQKIAKSGGWSSVEEMRKYLDVTPCDCGWSKCKGWQVRWKFGAMRR
jgi:hypothetical protein